MGTSTKNHNNGRKANTNAIYAWNATIEEAFKFTTKRPKEEELAQIRGESKLSSHQNEYAYSKWSKLKVHISN